MHLHLTFFYSNNNNIPVLHLSFSCQTHEAHLMSPTPPVAQTTICKEKAVMCEWQHIDQADTEQN